MRRFFSRKEQTQQTPVATQVDETEEQIRLWNLYQQKIENAKNDPHNAQRATVIQSNDELWVGRG